jgi:hypothetical protein
MVKIKRTNNDLQSIHIKLKIEQHEPTKNQGWTQVLRKSQQFRLILFQDKTFWILVQKNFFAF